MMNDQQMSAKRAATNSPHFLKFLAVIAVAGSISLLVGNVIGSIVVPDHDWISDTVSDLAAGRYEIIQDIALYGFAGCLIALSQACAHLHTGGWRWSALTVLLALTATAVIIIGARNEYGDGDNEGVVVHIYIVYAMGLFFLANFALGALVFRDIASWFSRLSWGACALWALAAPVFFIMPTAYDGIWERGLGMISIIWSLALGRVLWSVTHEK